VALRNAGYWLGALTLREAVKSVFPLNASKELFLPRNFCPFDLHLRDTFFTLSLPFSPRHLLVRCSPSASPLEI